MTTALLKVMILGLVRDRGALAMVFVLPPLIFMIFASIFAGIGGDELRLKIAILDQVNSPESVRLVSALKGEPSLRLDNRPITDERSLHDTISQGIVDVGLVIRQDLTSEDSPVLIIAHGGRAMAGPILSGHVQRIFAQNLPDIEFDRLAPKFETLTGGFSQQQATSLSTALRAMREDPRNVASNGVHAGGSLVAVETLTLGRAQSPVSYYAGSIAMLFLLLSAMQGATTLIEERNSGIVDRLAVSRAGIDVVVTSKFLFLVVQGILQAGIIFLIAWLIYNVDISERIAFWFIVTMSASAAAAGIGMMVVSACSTKQQANTISGFLVLIISAIGGSMVPRFMMPPWLQDLGWYTPNAWAIEAYESLLWREADLSTLAQSIWPLVLLACLSLSAAVALSRIRLRLG